MTDLSPDEKAGVEVSKSSSNTPNKPPRQWLVVGYVLMSFVFGFLGGWLATERLGNGASITGDSTLEVIDSESDLFASIAERVGPSVVSINVKTTARQQSLFFGDQIFESESAGTGIVLTSEGLIVTNKHVIPDTATGLSIVLADGTEHSKVKILGKDPFNDIAFIKVQGVSDLTPASLGDSSAMRVGDKVLAIGNALGQFSNTVTQGIISGLGRPITADDGFGTEQLQNLFQTDAAINPGNSGGPLVNVDGEVIGINTAVAGGAENIGFSIPINDVKPGITSVKENNELIRPYLGVRYVAITDAIAQERDLPVNRGALIVAGEGGQPGVLKNSPADKAGLKVGDIITKVGDSDINESTSLVTAISQYQVNETVPLTIIPAGGEEQTVEVTLEAAPDNL